MVTNSERFYNTVLDLLEDVDEMEEVAELMTWWNRYASPTSFQCSTFTLRFQSDLSQLFFWGTASLEEHCIS
jgi:hypothetical protein